MRFAEKKHGFYFISIVIMSLLIIFSFSGFVVAEPDEDPDDFDDCHERGEYRISSNTDTKITVDRGEKFNIDIKGKGPNVILKFNPVSVDNDQFEIDPTDEIEDNSKYDEDTDEDEIFVNFTLTAPNERGSYEILFYVRSPPNEPAGQPFIDFIVFEITVEKASTPSVWDFILNSVFDHYNIYLGSIAFGSLLIGTILYQIDFRKYSRAHGILSAVSLTFTSINVYFILIESVLVLISWLNPLAIDWIHLLHFSCGIVGYIACIIAALTGISGIKHQKWGYIALACWGFNFVFGIIWWGIGLV